MTQPAKIAANLFTNRSDNIYHGESTRTELNPFCTSRSPMHSPEMGCHQSPPQCF